MQVCFRTTPTDTKQILHSLSKFEFETPGWARSVARIIREGGQPATTAFKVLSATPDADLSGHGAPALLVDPATRSLPWTTLGASQAIPLRCAVDSLSWVSTPSSAGLRGCCWLCTVSR